MNRNMQRIGLDGGDASGASRGRSGSALLPALMIVAVLVILSLSWLQLSLTKNKEHVNSADTKRAFYIAEAGLSEAFAGLVAGQSGNVGGPGLPARFANGIFWVTAEDESDGKVTLTSTGLAGTGRASLSMVLENVADTVASKGAFGSDRVDVLGGAKIDSFDSREQPGGGPHGGPLHGQLSSTHSARVGSNDDIVVQDAPPSHHGARTEIFGDAQPGPSGAVLRGSNVTITGSTAPNPDLVSMPPISVPTVPSNGNIDYNSRRAPLTLPTGESGYGSVRVRAGAEMRVQGPSTLVVDSLQIDPSAELELDSTGGAILLYVRDYLHLAAGSILRTPQEKPGRVSLLVNAQQTTDRDGDGIADPPARLLSTGDVFATIYAPLASLSIPATFELFGAVAAKRLTVEADARVHFDLALTAASMDNGALPRLSGWRLVELPDSPLVSMRLDPLSVLRASGVNPPAASQAHFPPGLLPPGLQNLPNLILH